MLTISKLKRWSINYYIDTAKTAERASADLQRANGGLGEYYSEHETRTPVWLCAGDSRAAARLVGMTDAQRAGGAADAGVVARWLDDGVAPGGARGRAFGVRGVHGFDLTFCAPKSVSLIRVLRADEVGAKALANAHAAALGEAMEYLAAHAGYTRVHNGVTGEKDLVRLPGLVAVAYQHETSRCGDPHLHTHVIVPNRQARADGVLVSIDGTSLYHEAKAAGVIYQATLRRELHQSLGFEWAPVDPSTGMAEIAGVTRESIIAWSRRSSQLREWAAHHLDSVEGPLTAAQLAAAQKATRPTKPEELGWSQLQQQWRADERGLGLDRAAHYAARAARRADARTPFHRARLADAAAQIEKAAFTRADLVEIIGAQLPVDTEDSPRAVVEAAVDEIGLRLTAPRAAHEREGHERFTLARILAEEMAVLDLVDAQDRRSQLWFWDDDTAGLSAQQKQVVMSIGDSPWLVQPLSAPAGAGKTTSLKALAAAAHHRQRARVLVLAPTGKAVDVAMREGAGDEGMTIAKAVQSLRDGTLALDCWTLVVVDEAGMVGTDDLRQLLTATTKVGAKTVLVGDAHQLAPVKARGGMFAQLCTDLPWTQHLEEVWRMTDPDERTASLALRDGEAKAIGRAVDWYRRRDRLHCGDAITMAADALAAYTADVQLGQDALLLCDTTEMADALNQRIHRDRIDQNAATVTVARGQQVGVGDLIISRRNDPTIDFHHSTPNTGSPPSVRNGNRWRIAAIDTKTNRVAAERLDDKARVIFDNDYLRDHVTLGYAVTVHSAQGVTADASHAVLSENTSRALLYVAMTRGRQANTARLYQRSTEESEYSHQLPNAFHQMSRGDSNEAAGLVHDILTNDQPGITAHDYAARTPGEVLPDRVHSLLNRRAAAAGRRQSDYRAWQTERQEEERSRGLTHQQHIARMLARSEAWGIEL
ncbi:MobF family relaxase [Mycolicibacterium komossense]|uniref:Relaxase domain-containing protein n=1 Tax=Mycolicibacterium komossense TaxID=1779 RepID=A0ABT3CLU8_9MYCO|nr:MobF family relaxase [Mycolicibacterium komossense]MCV7230392.1 relaxase domain-containing protein [Mycolicibacterium komossense]